MSFESPDMAKDFPGLYRESASGEEDQFEEEERISRRKEVLVRRREARPERRAKGYRMFEEEDSEEESLMVAEDSTKSPSKMKKHSKPSFKFAKREKFYKPKEKDKDKEKEKDRGRDDHSHHSREREKSGDKEKPEPLKEVKKKDEKLRWKKRKLLTSGPVLGPSSVKTEPRVIESNTKPIFGVPLAAAVDRSKCHDGIPLPIIVRECIDYIEEFGLACEGIYRISGVKSKVQALKDSYNLGNHVYLHEHEPNIVASLLKLFLRELPEPVLTKEFMPKFEEASTVKNVKQKVEYFQQLIEQLPVPNKLLLSWMIVHMTHVIAKEKQNKMSLQNVSIVLSPTMQISHRVLNVLFTYARILFKDTIIKRHVPPLKPVTSHWSLDLPESPSALEEELRKQESLLSQLHEEVMKVKDSDKEEQLWEVQRVVTQLKRKIKSMKKTLEVHATKEKEIVMAKMERQEDIQKQKIQDQQQAQQIQDQQQTQQIQDHQQAQEIQDQQTQEIQDKQQTQEIRDQQQTQGIRDQQQTPKIQDQQQTQKIQDQQQTQKMQDQQQTQLQEQQNTESPPKQEPEQKPPEQQKQQEQEPVIEEGKYDGEVPEESAPTRDQDQVNEQAEITDDIKQPKELSSQEEINEEQEQATEQLESTEKLETVAEEPSTSDHDKKKNDGDEKPTEEQPTPVATSDVEMQSENTLDEVEEKIEQRLSPTEKHTSDDETKQISEEQATNEADTNKPEPTVEAEDVHEDNDIESSDENTSKNLDSSSDTDTPQTEPMSSKEQAQAAETLDVSGIERFADHPTAFQRISSSSEEGVQTHEQVIADIHMPPPEHSVQTAEREYVAKSLEPNDDLVDMDYEALQQLYNELLLEEEEQLALGDELRQKIQTETSEIGRLHQEIAELKSIHEDLYDSEEVSSDSSEEYEDQEDLQEILNELLAKNQQLETDNSDMSTKIQQERQICLNVKVQIRMIQQRQLDSSGGMLLMDGISESDALIQSLL